MDNFNIQLYDFMKDKLSNILTDFGKGHSVRIKLEYKNRNIFCGSLKRLWHTESLVLFRLSSKHMVFNPLLLIL